MPTYDGIGSSITHNVEVDGNLFLQDIEGGPDSTRVPLEIFSNLVSSSVESANSRMLRLRVQNYGETNTSNSYVTDVGIRGEAGKDYFFITAPQNTSNVGDQNTFVISSTSNVGIGTTNPEKPLHVVGDSWVTGTLTASNIIGASPITISSNLVMASGFTLTAGAIEPPTGSESNLKITGTITTSNITHDSELTITSNLLMGSEKTLTTSNIVANSGENLSLNSSLFVDTATSNVGIGVTEPSAPLHVYKNDTGSIQLRIENSNQSGRTGLGIVNSDGQGFNIQHIGGATATSNAAIIENFSTVNGGIHFYNKGDGDYIFRTTDNNTVRMIISNDGNVGIGITNPSAPLHVYKSSNYPEVLVDYGAGGQKMSMATGTDGSVLGYTGYLAMGTITGAQLAGFSEKFRIDSSGNVGIGTDSPGVKLDVEASSNYIPSIRIGSNTSYNDDQLYSLRFGGSQFMGMGLYSATQTVFGAQGLGIHIPDTEEFSIRTNGWTKMFALDGATRKAYFVGNVGIGIASPSAKLHVNGHIKNENPAFFAYRTAGSHNYATTGAFNYFNLTDVNRGSHYNTNTGRFTVPVDGVYHFYLAVIHRHISSSGSLEMTFYINGSNASVRGMGYTQVGYASDHDWQYISMTRLLSAGNYVQAGCHSIGTGTDYYLGDRLGYFGGFLIG